MFRRIKPDRDAVQSYLGQFPPHCDPRILHAPGDCEYCDKHPEWQALRLAWGIAFTGFEPEGTELPDPATHARGEAHCVWPGNKPKRWTNGTTPVSD